MSSIREAFIGSRSINFETEARPSNVGVALAIVGIDPSRNGENAVDPTIWTIKEKKTKPETEKIAGQISLPGETRKIGEELMPNIIGALSEFTNNSFDVRHNLFFMKDSSYIPRKVSMKGNPVDLVVLMYVGQLDKLFEPVDQDDVAPHKWMTINEIRDVIRKEREKVRKFAREIIEMEDSDQSVRKAVEEYFYNPMQRIPISTVLPQGFSSIGNFHIDREKTADVRVWDKRGNAE